MPRNAIHSQSLPQCLSAWTNKSSKICIFNNIQNNYSPFGPIIQSLNYLHFQSCLRYIDCSLNFTLMEEEDERESIGRPHLHS